MMALGLYFSTFGYAVQKKARESGRTLVRLGIVALAIVGLSMLPGVPGGVTAAWAFNETCNAGGGTANCNDVPATGIKYTDGSVTTVNVDDTAGGTQTVNNGVNGILLQKFGNSSNDQISFDFSSKNWVNVNTEEDPVLWEVAVNSVGNYIKFNGSGQIVYDGSGVYYLVQNSDGTIQIKNYSETFQTFANAQAFAQYLTTAGVGAGGGASGFLTVNNPSSGTNGADIIVSNANGIEVDSVAGKGSNGGCVFLLLVSFCTDGKDGGNAGSAVVNNDGTISVSGTNNYGVLATSQGGAGGNGGGTFGLFVSGAGAGGDGGNGGDVGVYLGANSNITTYGAGGHGVYAYSQGGNGGEGGTPIGGVALGDKGGNGGNAGAVTVDNQGNITTNGAGAYGIYAKSSGAGAGSGSNVGGIFAIGGNGGGQSDGNTVTVSNSGSVMTYGNQSLGIVAQSIGGGGGDGGSAGGLLAVGGRGGSGGNASTVTLNNSGTVYTNGYNSTAILAQSIGGGGGNGGNAVGVGAGLAIALGGSGGPGGNASNVYVNKLNGNATVADLTASSITTGGADSHGIHAQSIGGGGGTGGMAVSVSLSQFASVSVAIGGSGGEGGAASGVVVNDKGTVTTLGSRSYGILAQSTGGGGGSGGGSVALSGSFGYSLAVGLGGTGGKGGDGSSVDVNYYGGINTYGNQSHGIVAQSTGGGGGNGGFNVSGALGGAVAVSVGLGGTGGDGGDGGNVTVVANGDGTVGKLIETNGNGAHGILAQSVGGGGGNGGFSASVALAAGSAGVSLGADGGGGGVGGTVNLTNYDNIDTYGDNSFGAFAQSVGGGGGNGGFSLSGSIGVLTGSVSLGGNGGTGNYGSLVTLDNHGRIRTKGDGSYGVFAQSVGGGGGNGGGSVAISGAVQVEDVPGIAVSVALGGSGGGGGTGGNVNVTNDGSVYTGEVVYDDNGTPDNPFDDVITRSGDDAHGVFAQSVGGGGGTGGFSVAGAISFGNGGSAAIALGGDGGTGNYAGTVYANNSAEQIATYGDGSNGIYAQSVGGGGGDGGFGLSLSGSVGGQVNLALGVSIGGSGGSGGYGGLVTVDNTGKIYTDGENANGILAQSLGGGGGNGGFSASGSLVIGDQAGAVNVAIGGSGGVGNYASKVKVTNGAQIATNGKDSRGILAQSIGGGGGNGGISVVGQLVAAEDNSGKVGVSLGGDGGDGATGGEVEVDNLAAGTIITYGRAAHGIQAQSIGGGGGNGGLSVYGGIGASGEGKALSAGVSIGGSGGSGSTGGYVDVANAGNIRTYGVDASGISAQSIGGGGGDGGGSVTALLSMTNTTAPKATTVNLGVAIGGSGGSGNTGGNVYVNNSGIIITGELDADGNEIGGAGSAGIKAQSIGGGGGDGGRANVISIIAGANCSLPVICTAAENGKNNINLTATVGGDGGTGNDAGMVNVTNTGEILTYGTDADGIFAQSIGAGGGDGGNGIIGSGGISKVPVELAFLPFGQVAPYKDLSVAVGGDNGASGNGNIIHVNSSKSITTYGSGSEGIFAQSVGGGGGKGGMAEIGLTGKIGVGGKGGAAGDGGAVYISSTDGATIETFGPGAAGIFAQSVGGGGGIAGNVNRMLPDGLPAVVSQALGFDIKNLGIGLAIDQGGGAGGDGGLVDIDVAGNVYTHGTSSTGIFAQSIGGGGGVQGELGNDLPVLDLLNWHIGSNGDAGSAGDVTVDVTGNVYTAGNYAKGIFAQSQGGQGTGGNVDITVSGSVAGAVLMGDEDGTAENPLRGLGATAIMAQSGGLAGDGDITITLSSANGIVQGGRSQQNNGGTSYLGVGIWIVDGVDNLVTNHGTVRTADGVDDGIAIYATGSDADGVHAGGNETIDNFGTVVGSVALGAGTNVFNNKQGGKFYAGKFVDVGDGNVVYNDGLFSQGGKNNVFRTEVTGQFNQGTTGVYGVDLDLLHTGEGDEADYFHATNDVGFDGSVDINLMNVGNVKSGDHAVLLADTDATMTDNGLVLNVSASAVATYGLEFVDNQELWLNYAIDFDVAGMNPNESSVGTYLNGITENGAPTDLVPVIASLFNIPDTQTYIQTIDQLIPEAYLANETTLLMASNVFENNMMSCRKFDDDYKFSAEGECSWLSYNYRDIARSANDNYLGYNQTSSGLQGGMQVALNDFLFAGVSGAYDRVYSDTTTNASIAADRYQVGGVVKAQKDGFTVAVSAETGLSIADVTRPILFPNGPQYDVSGEQWLNYGAVHARISQSIEGANAYIKPILDVGITQIAYDDFAETGAPVALRIEGTTNTYATVTPAVEVGGQLDLSEGAALRAFLRAGVTGVVYGNRPELTAAFIADPDPTAGFVVSEDYDQIMYELQVGVDVVTADNFNVRLSGDARMGETVTSYGAQLKAGASF